MRALLKAFPNRITLHAPHGEPAASEWRTALERDVATMRERSNRRALAGLMMRCGIECSDIEAVSIRCGVRGATWAIVLVMTSAALSRDTVFPVLVLLSCLEGWRDGGMRGAFSWCSFLPGASDEPGRRGSDSSALQTSWSTEHANRLGCT